ncbi:hypothetical protein CHLNCDRAFT_55205 [Chlorella variabilis]|uniref:Small ribosomal subunit protein mS33 n=1 Tax=Chlorella variabilis TaxID=554065 RepID=E1ZS27_CHLVA|nr:hypothetical protein CHLNCDRAFT_55205 [Chlorella variabilis]EFN51343.1 hypothetical protein CHLNCDRAFT_55205 [Chlorella variabilis]|eukprot:XP_005843445.1 hypothetical protein CHLNCDRAFT_55205 [Chlorella variabilis]
MALAEGGPVAQSSAQHHALPTLVSLRSLWTPTAQPAGLGATAAAPALGSGCRRFNSGGVAAQQAAAQPAAEEQHEEEESLEQIRARIFGTHIGNGLRSGRKVLRRPLLGQKLVDYYPPDPIKADPLMLNLKAENAKLKLDRLRRRGKAPPKKGAGKRAGKKR